MSKARQLADLGNVYDDGALSHRNLIINGGMTIWQRGTSHTTASGYQSVDRWSFNTYTGGAFTVSKEVDSVHGNYLKWNRTAVDTAHPNAGNCIQQSIENARYVIADKKVTVSFWLKDDAGVGTGFVRIRQGASPFTALATQQLWVSSSSNWEYHTHTFDMPDSSTIGQDHVQLLIQMDNGTNQGGVSITKVQLEIGDTATPFEHRSYGDELARCQRYFSRIEPSEVDTGFVSATIYNTSSKYFILKYPMPMRAKPTITVSSAAHFTLYSAGGSYTATGFNIFGRTNERCEGRFSSGTMTTGYSSWARWNTYNGSAYLNIDAEL